MSSPSGACRPSAHSLTLPPRSPPAAHARLTRVFARSLGYPFVFLPERRLLAALVAALAETETGRPPCLHTATRVVDVRPPDTRTGGRATVLTAGMEVFSADLVVCCDPEYYPTPPGFRQTEFLASWGAAAAAVDADGLLTAGSLRIVSAPGVCCTTVARGDGRSWWWGVLKAPPASGTRLSAVGLATIETLRRLRLASDAQGEPEPVHEGVAESWWTGHTLLLGPAAYQVASTPARNPLVPHPIRPKS